ncbi:hypothetical protein C8J57DRAFT_1326357 [Mycena rebaudengoi]|nr:hypothetical protein C8J57DRAFT_1326357 [Mycena rebaudengoi]
MLKTDDSSSSSRFWWTARLALLFGFGGTAIALVAQLASGFHKSAPIAVEMYPGVAPVWDLGQLGLVKMSMEDTVRYPLRGASAKVQWESMVPKNGGIVHVGPEKTPYMLSMFHQLKCLDILRRMYVEDHHGELDAIGRHCLNYLRQTVLCRADLRLESLQDPDGLHAIDMYGDFTCTDWRQVYATVEENEKSMV